MKDNLIKIDPSTQFPFGKYKKWPIKHIPIKYLKSLKANFEKSPSGFKEHKNFLNELYGLKLGISALENDQLAQSHIEAEAMTIIKGAEFCTKTPFMSKKIANARIREINALEMLELKSGETKVKTPIRSYECKKCGAWHLTSQEKWFKKQSKQLK
jgi:hypothetical protein